VFGTILLLAVTLMHIYVFWRMSSVPFLRRHVPRRFLIITGVFFWAVFSLGRFFGHGGTGALARTLELISMDWMAIIFLTTVSLLAIDLVTGFGLLLPKMSPSLRGFALIAGGFLSLVALIQGSRPPVVQGYEVRLSGLPREMDGTVLVAMSDLHIGTLLGMQWLDKRIAQVQAERPDIVVLLGDIFEGHGEPQKELVQVLHGLSAPLGVWAVLGNHEFHGKNTTDTPLMNIDRVRVLNNTWAKVRPGLVLSGVDDLTANHRSGMGGDPLSKALNGRPAGATILLSHTPWQSEKAAATGVSLMLSGHTHGGQIWPFGYLVQQLYPLLEGKYGVDGMTVIVCRGTGTWGPRMRLWRPAEILRVKLRSAEK
jgi:uncharacterized protein